MVDQQSDILDGELISIQRDFPETEHDDDKLNVLFECNGKFFRVILMRRTLPGFDDGSDSIEQGFLERLDNCDSWDGGPEDQPPDLEEKSAQLYEEIENLVQRLLQPIFSDRAPVVDSDKDHSLSLPKDLDKYMNPDAFNLQFVTKNGQPRIIPRDDLPPPCFHPPISDQVISISPNTSQVAPSSITVLEPLGRTWVLKVAVGGEVMCCKITSQAIHESLSQEYGALQRITDEFGEKNTCSTRLQVPALKGVVMTNKGKVVGILMDYIPMISNLAKILKCNYDGEIIATAARRTKSASQIEHTLKCLHAIDVVWGDAKTSNILIDDKDNAWIVDFGGGQTWGWIDTELVGTKDGDLQALQKITQALQVSGGTEVVEGEMRQSGSQ